MKHLCNFTIADRWACPLIYGDYSCLTDDEERDLIAFIQRELPSHYHVEVGEHVGFAVDHVSQLLADCVEIRVYKGRARVQA